jgi:hypothetical protein
MPPRNPPADTEPGETSPGAVRDLRSTSDIRLVMIELATVKERMTVLIENDRDHRADFRWTWAALVAAFLILAGFFIAGYNRVEDKLEATSAAIAKVDTKSDDILQRLNALVPPHR